jgi:hypothetical protein
MQRDCSRECVEQAPRFGVGPPQVDGRAKLLQRLYDPLMLLIDPGIAELKVFETHP